MFSYQDDDTDEEECAPSLKSAVRDIDQAFTRLGKNIVSVFLPSNNSSIKTKSSDLSTLITGTNVADDESSQSQSNPASSKGKRPMRPASTNQPKGSSSRRQEPLMSPVVPQGRSMTCPPSPDSKDNSSDARRLMPPPPIPQLPRQRPQREKLTTEQVVRVFIQMRLL